MTITPRFWQRRTDDGVDLALLAAIGLVVAIALLIAGHYAQPILLDLGPNDSEYVTGFRDDWEPDGKTRFHWTHLRSRISLPFHLQGPQHRLRLRARRHFLEPAQVKLTVEGRPVGRFSLQAHKHEPYKVFEFPLPQLTGRRPFELGLVSRSSNPRPLGVALDWIEIVPAPGGVGQGVNTWLRLLAMVVVAYVLPRLAGAGRLPASLHALLVGLVFASAGAMNPLALERWLREGWQAYALVGALALVLVRVQRFRTALAIESDAVAGWLLLLVQVALLVRLLVLLHPQYFYPDVRVHAVFARELGKLGPGEFLRRFTELQYRFSLGLQFEAGHWYAFPYPPAFYALTAPLIRLAGLRPEVAVSLFAAAVNSLEVCLIFGLVRRLFGSPAIALAAAAFVPVLPLFITRLSLAYFPAVVGHAVDVLVLLYLSSHLKHLHRGVVVGILGLAIAVALLTYTQSVLNLGLLLPLFLVVQMLTDRSPTGRKRQLGLLMAGVLGVSLSLAFYGRYIPVFLDMQRGMPMPEEAVLLEKMARSPATEQEEAPDDPFAGPGVHPWRGLKKAAWRLALFYNVFGLAVVLGGYMLLKRTPDPDSRRLAAVWMLTYVMLNLASGGLPGPNLVRYNKDLLLLAPMACAALGYVTVALARRGRLWGLAFGLSFWVFGAARTVASLTQTFFVEGR